MIDPAAMKPAQDLSNALSHLVASVASGLVSVASQGSRTSGFIWKPGFVITADEPLADDGELHVTFGDGKTLPVQLAGRDPTTDLVLLRVERTDSSPLALSATHPAAGDLTLAVGADQGAPVATFGMVARAGGAWRSMRGGDIDQRIELDVSLRRSSEGGVAVDMSGRVFGMVVFGPRRRALVIPASTIERVARTLEAHGRIARGYLGLGLQPIALSAGGGSGAIVISVDPNGPGARSGLHQGDVVVSWDEEPVPPMSVLQRVLGPDSVGRKIALGISRGGKQHTIPLTISERPAT